MLKQYNWISMTCWALAVCLQSSSSMSQLLDIYTGNIIELQVTCVLAELRAQYTVTVATWQPNSRKSGSPNDMYKI